MRSFGFRLMLLVGILWAGIGSTVWALGHGEQAVETVYVMPSSLSLPVPTSYVVSSSWVEPTAYAVPTYYTTAYWMDPVVLAQPTYAPTAYVRRGGLFGRRWVVERPVLASYTTSYAPTAYYATPAYRATSLALADRLVVPSAYLTTADCICPPVVASAAPTYAAPSRGTGTAFSGTDSRARTRLSEPEDRASMPSDVGPAPTELRPYRARGEAGANMQDQAPAGMPDISDGFRDNTPRTPPATPRPQTGSPSGSSAPGGFDLRLMSWGDGTGVPTSGNNLVIVGTDNNNLLHIRIFDQNGRRVTDLDETKLPPAQTQAILVLKQRLPSLLPPHVMTGPEKAQVLREATSFVGQTPTGGGQTESIVPPQAPGDVDGNPPALGPGGETRRDSLRPNYALTAARPRYANILMGTVLSSSDGQPEEGVQIRVRNAATGGGKTTTTNAFGRFAVRVADGEWAVDVTMPSGRTYEVSQLRVVDGVISDSLGRRIPSLEITR